MLFKSMFVNDLIIFIYFDCWFLCISLPLVVFFSVDAGMFCTQIQKILMNPNKPGFINKKDWNLGTSLEFITMI